MFKYDKQDQQGKAAFNERNPTRTSNKSQWQGAQEDPKQKQARAKGRVLAGQVYHDSQPEVVHYIEKTLTAT
jgi:hypothetical protein